MSGERSFSSVLSGGIEFLWLLVTALYLAFMNALDLLFNLTALKVFNYSIVELGFFNGLWILVYMFSVRVAGRIVDRGLFRRAMIISVSTMFISMTLYMYSVDQSCKTVLYISYMLHSVAVSFTRLATSTSILENYESSKWDVVSRRFVYLIVLFESIILITFSIHGFYNTVQDSHLVFTALVITGLLAIRYVPEPALLIERILFTIEKSLSKMLIPVHASLSLSYQSINLPSKLQIVSDVLRSKYARPAAILLCLIGLRVSNEYMLTPLPYHMFLVGGFTADQVLLVYGASKLLASFFIAYLAIDVMSRGSRVSAILARLLSAIMIYMYIENLTLVIPLLALILYTNAVMDGVLYTLYIEATHGYKTEKYTLVNELSGFTGSLTSGLIYLLTGTTNILISMTLTTIMFLTVMIKPNNHV